LSRYTTFLAISNNNGTQHLIFDLDGSTCSSRAAPTASKLSYDVFGNTVAEILNFILMYLKKKHFKMITEFQTHQLQPSLDVNDDITSTVSFKQLDRKTL
jgi:hypothetical protein